MNTIKWCTQTINKIIHYLRFITIIRAILEFKKEQIYVIRYDIYTC
jgi:hypothetical protein